MLNTPKIEIISIIIPAYKQEKKIVQSVRNVEKILKTLPFKYELIIVVDGIVDKTFQKASKIKSEKIKIFAYQKNLGKGYAVKYGVERARGDVIGFMDAGMDIDPEGVINLINEMRKKNADIAIGSKVHKESKVNYPPLRKVLSWGYRNIARFLFGFDVSDTQVGLKIFKRRVAKDIFRKIMTKGFAFDIEVLVLAQILGYKKIVEAPVKVRFKKAGSITSANFWLVVVRMLWDTGLVFYRLKISKYYDKIHK